MRWLQTTMLQARHGPKIINAADLPLDRKSVATIGRLQMWGSNPRPGELAPEAKSLNHSTKLSKLWNSGVEHQSSEILNLAPGMGLLAHIFEMSHAVRVHRHRIYTLKFEHART
jgi:hypothetical protein